jgi:hypothetical protein
MKKKNTFPYYLLPFLFFVLASCHKKDNPVPNPPANSDVDVYVAGSDSYGAKLWKNGTAISLPSGVAATDMLIVGNDIYISGYGYTSNDTYVAKYWKNGVVKDLTDGSQNAFAQSILVKGNDIYVAGRERQANSATYIAKYWKNGVAVNLSGVSENASLNGLAIVGNDVYAIGMHNQDAQSPVACYWKNGQVTDLSTISTYAERQAIAVSGSDIYMMWSESYNDSGKSQASYSKNFGPANKLNDDARDFQGYSISANGSDVYVTGTGVNPSNGVLLSKYYKNGSPVVVTNNPNGDFATNLTVERTDVYVSGWTQDVAPGKAPTACYWKNGTRVLLGDGSSQSAANKIIVIRK